MAYFQLGDKQFPLRAGAQRVGPDGTGADLVLPDGPATATAVVVVNPDQSVVIQRATPDSVVKVNSVVLGPEPTPLIHGDHVELGGHDLRFGDMKQSGNTQFISGADVAAIARARQGLQPAKPTTATGGRLVSLVDGREYAVAVTGLTIGRDPSVEVVVPTTEVSRRHAHIAPVEHGYLLTDLSTNGVWVNGTRVVQNQVLGRGDVIKIGTEEFRFYADVAKASAAAPAPAPPVPAPAPAAPPPAPMPAAAVPRPATPPSPAPAAPSPATPPSATPAAPPRAVPPSTPMEAAPAQPQVVPSQPKPAPAPGAPLAPVPAAPKRPAFATLEVINEGPDKGKRFDVYGHLTNIGRGAHNDLVLTSESVSDSHAKLQKRDAGWYIVDAGSTNGTYVGGRRVQDEQALVGAPDLRFGDVKVGFRPTAETIDEGKATRAIVGVSVAEARRIAERRVDSGAHPSAPAPAPEPGRQPAMASPAVTPTSGRTPVWLWLLVVIGIGAVAAYFFFRGA